MQISVNHNTPQQGGAQLSTHYMNQYVLMIVWNLELTLGANMCCMGTDSELSAPAHCLHVTFETSVSLLYIQLCETLPTLPRPACLFQAEEP